MAVALADSAMFFFLDYYLRSVAERSRGGILEGKQECIGKSEVNDVGRMRIRARRERHYPTFENEVDQISVRTYGVCTCSGLFGGEEGW